MNKPKRYLLLLMVVLFILIPGCTLPVKSGEMNSSISVVDSLGKTSHIVPPITRIVTQNSDVADMLITIGADGTIVGVSDSILDIPEISKKIPNAVSIGNWQTPNIEKIISLSPEVMITYGGRTKNIDQILAANITVLSLDLYRVPNLAREARVLGLITGRIKKSEEYAHFIEKYLDMISVRLSNSTDLPHPRIYMEHYGEYTSEGEAGAGTELLNLLHTSHIGADLPGLTQKVTPEWIIEQKPDVIIKIISDENLTQNDLNQTREKIMTRNGFNTIPAVQSGRVYVINGDLINSPKGIVGTIYVAKVLYPGVFDDISPNTILHEYADTFDTDIVSARYAPFSDY